MLTSVAESGLAEVGPTAAREEWADVGKLIGPMSDRRHFGVAKTERANVGPMNLPTSGRCKIL